MGKENMSFSVFWYNTEWPNESNDKILIWFSSVYGFEMLSIYFSHRLITTKTAYLAKCGKKKMIYYLILWSIDYNKNKKKVVNWLKINKKKNNNL